MSAAAFDLRRVVVFVALLNLSYFGVEFSVALAIGSVSLFADSVDFLEDASLNALVLIGLSWPASRRKALGIAMAAILLVPAAATLWTAVQKLTLPMAPAAVPLTVTGAGALLANFICAAMLMRFRHQGGSLSLAAFLSARNDVLANVAIILAGLVTAYRLSPWPDLVVGLGIALVNADSAREVFQAARNERDEAVP
ncbi:MAG: cation transporter [Methyloceanibacter sp.]